MDILRNLYVDDLASGTSDDGSAVNYYQDARNKMSPVGFNLRSWSSNSPVVQYLAAKDQVLDISPTKKVLGMLWDITSDTLRFSCKQGTSSPPLSTKREVLQETAKAFDSLGLLQPVTVAAKILIQELCKELIDRDELLPPFLDQKWRAVAKEIADVIKLEFPRHYFTSDVSVDSSDTELHVFPDTSQKVYGAAAYLLLKNQSSLSMARSRVAPTKKKLTLPELEFMAALTAARLASYLQEQLQVTRVTFWSDSQIVLHWLRSSKLLKPFINTRIQEVKKLTSISNWKYCPTTENPSDLLPTGITAHQLKTSSLWKHGPTWLPNRSQCSAWPTTEVLHLSVTETSTDGSIANGTVSVQQQGLHCLINPSDFSSLPKLLRVTDYIFRFVQLLQKKVSQRGPITAIEYDHAMTEWVKNRQSVVFHAEVDNLLSKSRHRTTLVRQLRLFLDDGGLLRCGGRIHTFKWQHQISSAATKQRPLHRSSNSLHPCQETQCRCQLNSHRPASKLLGSLWPTTCQNLNWQMRNLQKGFRNSLQWTRPTTPSQVKNATNTTLWSHRSGLHRSSVCSKCWNWNKGLYMSVYLCSNQGYWSWSCRKLDCWSLLTRLAQICKPQISSKETNIWQCLNICISKQWTKGTVSISCAQGNTR